VDELEATLDADLDEVAEDHPHLLPMWPRPQPLDHPVERVDPVHVEPAPGERGSDSSGADPELEHAAATSEFREELDGRGRVGLGYRQRLVVDVGVAVAVGRRAVGLHPPSITVSPRRALHRQLHAVPLAARTVETTGYGLRTTRSVGAEPQRAEEPARSRPER